MGKLIKVREGLTYKVTFEQRPQGSEKVKHWGQNIPSSRDNMSKNPETRPFLLC